MEVKALVIKRLKMIINLLEKGEYDEIDKFLGYSPGNDDASRCNHYICFGRRKLDIYDTIEYIERQEEIGEIFLEEEENEED